jgi:hypothetical protein
MSRTSLTPLLPALLAAGLCASAGQPARGQPPSGPSPGYGAYPAFLQPPQQSQVYGRTTAPPAGYAPPPGRQRFVPGFAPFTGVPYVYPWGINTGGGLTGAANVINAQGEFEMQWQQARLLNQEVERSKMDTRRRRLEDWMWERDNLPTRVDNIRRDQAAQLQIALNNPAPLSVWNGSSLNNIFAALKQVVRPGDPGPTVPLDPRQMLQISYTTGATSLGVGLLKNGPKLQWPFALTDDRLDAPRAEIDLLMKTAYDQMRAGNLDGKVLRQLNKSLDQMDATLRGMTETMPPTQNIQGRRFVRQLRDTVRALEQPDAAGFFAATRSFPASSVGELVQTMMARGLTFAPAMPGNEPAYTALHTAMVTFYNLLSQPTIRGAPPSLGM